MENRQINTPKPNSKEALRQLEQEIETILFPLGYECVAIEFASVPKTNARAITLFIDFLENSNSNESVKKISLEDCVTVSKAVDAFFESTALISGSFNLEVSSPGVERPIRKLKDYERFCGRQIRVNTFRALEEQEAENPSYWSSHPKQKTFVGQLNGLSEDREKVCLNVEEGIQIYIPLQLISKARLEFELKE